MPSIEKKIVRLQTAGDVYQEANARIVRGQEALIIIARHYRSDGHLYIDIAGTTMPDARYSVTRSADNNHWRDQYVFEYVVAGRGHIECAGQRITVGAGDFYFLNRLHAHHYYADQDDPFEKLWINVSGRLVNTLVELYGITAGVVVRHCDVEAEFRDIHTALASLTPSSHADTFAAVARHLLHFIQILSRPEADLSPDLAAVDRIEQIRRYIDDRGGYNVTLGELAEHFCLNAAYLAQIFRDAYGLSPTQYIASRRIDAAKTMLLNASTPVGEIASILRFSSSQHFSTAFKAATGMTPGQYRKKNKA